MRDCSFLKPLSPRRSALAGGEADAWPARLQRRHERGMKAGSFWPSPSRVTTTGARAARDAGAHGRALAAALGVAQHAQPGPGRARARASAAGVPSVEPSST